MLNTPCVSLQGVVRTINKENDDADDADEIHACSDLHRPDDRSAPNGAVNGRNSNGCKEAPTPPTPPTAAQEWGG